MDQRLYIDINAGVGKTSFRWERIPYTVDSLADDMAYYRIHASLVYSNAARDYSFVKGNRELLEQIRSSDRLYGVAVIIPDIQYELEEGFGYYDDLLKQGIKAFKTYPAALKHEFTAQAFHETANYMAERNIPLLVDTDEINWADLRGVLAAFPDLKVVLCNSYWEQDRYVFPIMDKFRNLYMDISANQANGILQRCKTHFGLDRVLFGTSYPSKSMGGLKALVEYSGLSDEEKDRVSYKNAAALFGIEAPAPYSDEECRLDEIAAMVDRGKALDNILVVDAHTHLIDSGHRTVSHSPMLYSDEHHMVRKMDALGIDKMFISAWEGLDTDGRSANETDLKAWENHRDRIEVYAMCNPNYQEDLDAVVEFHEKYGFKGLKPYYSNNRYDLLGEKYNAWFEYGNKNKLIMLVHTGVKHLPIPEKVAALSEKYKDMAFLMAHSGADYETAKDNIEVVKKRDNVFLEITYTTLTNNIIEYMVEEVGADKVIFGTDMPMRDPAPQLAWVCYAKIPVADKKKILGGNIQKLLERCYDGVSKTGADGR